MKHPPRVRGYICMCEEEPKVDFCWEQWELGPFKDSALTDHTVEYLSLQEHTALCEEQVRAEEEAHRYFMSLNAPTFANFSENDLTDAFLAGRASQDARIGEQLAEIKVATEKQVATLQAQLASSDELYRAAMEKWNHAQAQLAEAQKESKANFDAAASWKAEALRQQELGDSREFELMEERDSLRSSLALAADALAQIAWRPLTDDFAYCHNHNLWINDMEAETARKALAAMGKVGGPQEGER